MPTLIHRVVVAAVFMLTILGLSIPGRAAAAPAPALSYLQVLAVASANSPTWEYVVRDQFLTNVDHGGAWLYIATEERGYGYTPVAKFNGVTIAQYKSDPIVENGIIVGYIRYWYITSNTASGQFTYQNTSTNSPWNTMSDWISIK